MNPQQHYRFFSDYDILLNDDQLMNVLPRHEEEEEELSEMMMMSFFANQDINYGSNNNASGNTVTSAPNHYAYTSYFNGAAPFDNAGSSTDLVNTTSSSSSESDYAARLSPPPPPLPIIDNHSLMMMTTMMSTSSEEKSNNNDLAGGAGLFDHVNHGSTGSFGLTGGSSDVGDCYWSSSSSSSGNFLGQPQTAPVSGAADYYYGTGQQQLLCNNNNNNNGEVKVGQYTAEERKDRILRYLKKRNQRNFNKTIKYACRKTLADRRVRVRGRFARNVNELSEEERTPPPEQQRLSATNSNGDNRDDYNNQPYDCNDDEWLQEAVANLLYAPYSNNNVAPYNNNPQYLNFS